MSLTQSLPLYYFMWKDSYIFEIFTYNKTIKIFFFSTQKPQEVKCNNFFYNKDTTTNTFIENNTKLLMNALRTHVKN